MVWRKGRFRDRCCAEVGVESGLLAFYQHVVWRLAGQGPLLSLLVSIDLAHTVLIDKRRAIPAEDQRCR